MTMRPMPKPVTAHAGDAHTWQIARPTYRYGDWTEIGVTGSHGWALTLLSGWAHEDATVLWVRDDRRVYVVATTSSDGTGPDGWAAETYRAEDADPRDGITLRAEECRGDEVFPHVEMLRRAIRAEG